MNPTALKSITLIFTAVLCALLVCLDFGLMAGSSAANRFASITGFRSAFAPPQIFVVTNTNDSGAGSLRQALQDANNNAGPDTINFNISGSGVQTITLLSALPGSNEPIVIDASTQPGYAGTPLIEINGNGVGGDGLTLNGGSSTVRGLIINRFNGNGINMQNSGGNLIAGNYIGTDAAGTATAANTQNGIQLLGPPNTTIGGLTAADRNIISGNGQNGIVIQNGSASNNLVVGNYIGVDVTGTVNLGNGSNGIRIDAPSETIGGSTAAARNIISGNGAAGIVEINSGSSNNRVQGNYIGTNAAGTAAIPNGYGVVVGNQVALRGVPNGFIGTDGDSVNDATEGNLISGNTNDGVLLTLGGTTNNRVSGNRIGTNAAGTAAIPNGGRGVQINQGASGNFIGSNLDGTSDALEGNLISGNTGDGVLITDGGTNSNGVAGNLIGTDVTGVVDVGNGGNGVTIQNAANNNIIGGVATGAGNVICFNAKGVVVGANTGDNTTGNLISRNSIFTNDSLGIDLSSDGVTLNDSGDGDGGPNQQFNFPVLTAAQISGGYLQLSGFAGPGSTIELFISDSDASGFGEGRTYLTTLVEGSAGDLDASTGTYGPGAVNGLVQGTDTTNRFSFLIPMASLPGVSAGTVLTATGTSSNNTSEFSGQVITTGVGCISTLTVNDNGDAPDANPGDGFCATAGTVCTLRAAIEEAMRSPDAAPSLSTSA